MLFSSTQNTSASALLRVAARAAAIDVAARTASRSLGVGLRVSAARNSASTCACGVQERGVDDRRQRLAAREARRVGDEPAVHQRQRLQDRRLRLGRLVAAWLRTGCRKALPAGVASGGRRRAGSRRRVRGSRSRPGSCRRAARRSAPARHPGEQPRVGLRRRASACCSGWYALLRGDRADQDREVELRRRRTPRPARRAAPGGSAGSRRRVRRPGRRGRGRRSAPTSGSPGCGRRTGCPRRSSTSASSLPRACRRRTTSASVPSRNVGGRRSCSVFGMVSRLRSYCGGSGPTKLGGDRRQRGEPPKNAANSQNCSCVYGANGWSWHWAHSSLTPEEQPARRWRPGSPA